MTEGWGAEQAVATEASPSAFDRLTTELDCLDNAIDTLVKRLSVVLKDEEPGPDHPTLAPESTLAGCVQRLSGRTAAIHRIAGRLDL